MTFATPSEVREVLTEEGGSLLEFTEKAEATEYLQSVRYLPDSDRRLGPHQPNDNESG